MEEGSEIWILNKSQKIENSGKEWIKFFSIPIWCSPSNEKYYYFPPLDHISYEDENVKSALSLLAESNFSYEKNYIDQKNMEKIIEEYHSLKEDNDILKEDNDLLRKEKEE